MEQPIYRYLTEKRWREDGALDLLVGFLIHIRGSATVYRARVYQSRKGWWSHCRAPSVGNCTRQLTWYS